MRITLGNVVLADYGRESVTGFRVVPEEDEQVVTFLRGTQIQVYPRGNFRNVVTFSMEKQHASIDLAQLYCLELGQKLVGQKILIYTTSRKKFVRYMTVAQVKVTQNEFCGVRTYHSFRILGGLVTSKP